MKVTLTNSENKKIKRKLGFSLKFFIFGSLVYLFSKKFVKFIFLLIFYFLTLVWLIPQSKFDQHILTPLTKFFNWGPLETLNLNQKLIEFVDSNKELFKIKDYSVTLYAVIGLSAFLLLRLLIALSYNRHRVKKLVRNGYTGYSEVDIETLRLHKIISAKKAKEHSRKSGTFNYNRNPSTIATNSSEAQKKADLELLNNAYASGMLSKEIYLQKRNEIERGR